MDPWRRHNLGSRGPPRALPPHPTTPQPCSTSDSAGPPNPARRARTQRNHEGHRNPEPAQCTDAGLVPPRESLVPADKVHPQSPRRSKVFRKPVIWLCCSLLFSSPGSHTRTDATRMSWPATGAPTTEAHWSLAPGEDHDDLQLHAVPLLRCSEHASSSMQSSNLEQQGRTPPRCMNTQQQVAGTSQRSIKRPCLSGRRVPGTSLSSIMSGRNLRASAQQGHDCLS